MKKFQCSLSCLEEMQREVRDFCKCQTAEYTALRRKCEQLNWDDANYDKFVDQMNDCGAHLADALERLMSESKKVCLIDEMIPVLKEYVESEMLFSGPGRM